MSTASFRRLCLLFVLPVWVSGCGGSPNAPTDPSVSGSWIASDRSFTWHLAQSGLTVTGTQTTAGGQDPPTAIDGTMIGREFSFRVVTGQRLVTFLDPPELVDVGWYAQVTVTGNQMVGSISSMGSPGRHSIREVTLRRIASAEAAFTGLR